MAGIGFRPSAGGRREVLVIRICNRSHIRPILGLASAAGALALAAGAGFAGSGRHQVSAGETLGGIAAQEGTSVAALAAANGIRDPDVILVGQVLTIPAATPGRSPDSVPTGSATSGPGPAPAASTYVVREGDNLVRIAARLGTTPAALARANGLRNPTLVVVGTALKVPEAPSAGAGAQAVTGRLPEQLRTDPQRRALRANFRHWAGHYGVPPDLLEALAWMESGWQNGVVSPAGARGIGQLMPDTVALARLFLANRSLDPGRADDNIRMSAWFLGYLLRQTGGDSRLAVGAYYQGLRSVTTGPLLAETERYVAAVIALRPLFA